MNLLTYFILDIVLLMSDGYTDKNKYHKFITLLSIMPKNRMEILEYKMAGTPWEAQGTR